MHNFKVLFISIKNIVALFLKHFFFLFSGRQTRWSRSRSSPPSHNLVRSFTCNYGSQPEAYIASKSQPTPHLQVRILVFFICEILQTPCFKKLSSVLLRIWRRTCGWWIDFRYGLGRNDFFKKEDKKLSQVDRNINMIFVIKI